MVMTATTAMKNYSDNHYTSEPVAERTVRFFEPTGRVLEPCRGGGAFMRYLPDNSDWCEIAEGKDFFQHTGEYDWIVTNPPYSNLTDWMRHAFKLADNVVFLIPLSKLTSSATRISLVRQFGGVKNVIYFGPGRQVGMNFGFPVGAVHFQRGYRGPTNWFSGFDKQSTIKEAEGF